LNRFTAGFALAFLISGAARSAPDSRSAALAAGYKAAFVCGGMCDASQSEAAIDHHDLAMLGNRGQFVFIVPSRHVVIVRRGFDLMTGKQFDGAAFARDVLAAL
jgi:hypothetical protein